MSEMTSEARAARAAALALKGVARDESLKEYVANEPALHDVLLRAAMRFIGGEQLGECLQETREINDNGFATSIDYMGESTRDARIAEEATREFEHVVDAISEQNLDSSISLDLSHVGLVLDADLCYQNASTLAAKAQKAGIEMMVSMEGSERTDEVLAMYRRLSERYSNVGITIQVYLHSTQQTLKRMLEYPGRIRLVKGAFEEPKTIAMPRGEEIDAAYRAAVETVLASRHPCSIATHDPVLLEHAHAVVSESGSDASHVEFEMLKGVELDRLRQMRDLGYRSRVYLPYGEEWYLYLCHRLAEYPPNIYQAVADAIGSEGDNESSSF